jgi:hypothetical protein
MNAYVEVAAVVCGALTGIVGMSLAFAARVLRWDREDNERARAEELWEAGRGRPQIYPYIKMAGYNGTLCPVCGITATRNEGICLPSKCEKKDACSVDMPSHLHVFCMSCKSSILMEPFSAGKSI